MDRCFAALAILAICVSGALSIPGEPDPINPEYGEIEYDIDCEWGEWGSCGATCGIGVQQRTIKYEAVNDGENCTGPATRECTSPISCPIDCKWSQWKPCSKTCGNGNQVRAVEIPAQHGGRECTGSANKECNLKSCPIDCEWGQWRSCSKTCGPGNQNRVIEQQAQHGGRDCSGSSVKGCNLKHCPIDCEWGQWGFCSETCGPGNQNRVIEQQAQHGGRDCRGSSVKGCNLKSCPFDCVWGQWGTCSKTCGSGIQKRAVRLEARNGGEKCMGEKIRDCKLRPCPIDCKWGQWGSCSSNCGNGEQARTFEIEAQHGGQECQGEAKRNCNEEPCVERISLTELMHYELCKDWKSYLGFHIPNPENCKTYFQCQANGAFKGGYEAILRDCGAQTGFDPSLGNCNFLSSLPRCVRDFQPKYVYHGSSCLLELYGEKVLRGKTRPFRSSTWVFSGDTVRSVKNSGGCCWDVYTSSRKYKFFTAIKPGYTNLEIKGSFYLKKRKCERGEI